MIITLNGKRINMDEIDSVEFRRSPLVTDNKPALLLFFVDSSDYIDCVCDTDEEYIEVVEVGFRNALAEEKDFDFDEARRKAKEKLK